MSEEWQLYRLVGGCPATSIQDLIDYCVGDPKMFLDRFFIEPIPEDELDAWDKEYLRELNETIGEI